MIFDSPEANQRLSDTAAEAPPATFMERFHAADKQGQLRGTVLSPGFAVSEDYDRRIKDIKDAGLGDLTDLNPMWNSKPTQRAPHVYSEGHSIYDMEPVKAVEDPHEAFQKRLEQLQRDNPDKAHIIKADKPITGSVAYEAAKKAQQDAQGAYGGPPLTGPIADFAGGMYALRYDPFQLGALVFGPTGPVRQTLKSVLAMGAKQAALNMSVEAAMQPFVQSWRKSMNDTYGWWDAAEEIGIAGAFGLGTDVGVRMLYRRSQARLGRKAILDENGGVVGYESGKKAAARAEGIVEQDRTNQIVSAYDEARIREAEARNLEIQKNLEALPKDTLDKVAQGDEEATIALAKALKADEDPSVGGAINALRNTDRVTLDGIDDGWRERSLIQQLRALEDPSEPAPVHFDAAAKAERPRLADDAELPKGTEGNQHYRMLDLDGKPVRFEAVDSNRITTDPATFQFKGGRDAAGASNALKAVDFNGEYKGKVIVYEREDGSLVVADGRDRVSLANRAPEPQKLDALIFREKDGWTAEQVRAEAARKNIQEGTGSLMDVAGAIRRHPEIVDDSMAVSTDFMADARSIARLSDEAFDAVASGQFNPKHGVMVSDLVPDQSRHMEVLRELDRGNPPTEAAARREIGNMLREPANIETLTRVMDIPLAEPHVLEARNEVLAGVLTTLRGEPGYIGEIETQAIASVIRRLSEKPGLVSDVLAQAGRAVAEGQPIERAIDATLRRFEDVIGKAGVKGLADQPVRLASISRGLDMSPEARKARAEQMGFDTSETYFHTSGSKFDAFDLERGGGALGPSFGKGSPFFSGANVEPYYLRLNNKLSFNTGYEVTPRDLVQFVLDGNYKDVDGQTRAVKVDLSPDDRAALANTIAERGWSADRAAIVRDVMRRNGVDGFEFVHEMATETIPFDPTNIRSVNATFDPAEAGSARLMAALSGSDAAVGRSMRADLDRLGYYSKALEAAKSLKQAKGTPEQMLSQLKSAGVKDAEIEATNLKQFLDGKTSVTRDDLVKHLTENRVGVNEVVADRGAPQQLAATLKSAIHEARSNGTHAGPDAAISEQPSQTARNGGRSDQGSGSNGGSGGSGAEADASQGLSGPARNPGVSAEFSIPGYVGRRIDVTSNAGLKTRYYFAFPAGVEISTRLTGRAELNHIMAFNKWAARAAMVEREPGRWEISEVKVRKNQRRAGVGTYFYDQMERDMGAPLQPSGMLTDDGYQFRMNRDPESVQWHRKVGDMWLSPKQLLVWKGVVSRLAETAESLPEIRSAMKRNDEINAAISSLPDEAFARRSMDAMFALSRDRVAWSETPLEQARREHRERHGNRNVIQHDSYVARDAEHLTKDVRRFEERLWKDGRSADEIATAIKQRYGFEVDAEDIAKKHVWWRVKDDGDGHMMGTADDNALKSIVQDDEIAEYNIYSAREGSDPTAKPATPAKPNRPTPTATPRSTVGHSVLTAEQAKSALSMYRSGVMPSSIAERLAAETGKYVRVQQVIDALEREGAFKQSSSAGVNPVVWHARERDALRTAIESGKSAAETVDAIKQATGRVVSEKAVYVQSFKMREAGQLQSGRAQGSWLNEGKFQWTKEALTTLTRDDVAAMKAGDAAKLLSEMYGGELTANAVRVKRMKERKVKRSVMEEGQPLFAKPAENITPTKLNELAENLRQALDEATTPPPGRLDDPIKDAPKQVERLREDLAEDIAVAMGQPSPAQLAAIRAFHGSPYDFDKFDISKIGTGEGAQAYGHGLYFAENEGVAQTYKGAGPVQQWSSLDPPTNPGRMYEVSIKADPNDFLDWDKPLLQQSEKVRGAVAKLAHIDPGLNGNPYPGRIINIRGLTPDKASAALREAGIPGIRYLDQGSRGAGEGSRNYVVFDDSLIEIVAKDGKPVTPEEKKNILADMRRQQAEERAAKQQAEQPQQQAQASPLLDLYQRYVAQGREALDAVMPGTGRMIDEFVQANPEVVSRIAEALGAPTGRPQAAQMLEQAMPQFMSPRIIDMSKPVLLTPEANARMREIRTAIDETVKMLPPEYRIRVEDSLVFNFGDGDKRLDGLHDGYEKLIYVSMAAGDPVRTSRHEVIHALRQSGLMKDEEFAALYKFADRLGLRKAYEIDAQYKDPYTQAYGNRGADFVEQLLREETVANMFSDYSLNGRRFGDVAGGGMVDRLIDMIVSFMKQVRDIMGGYGFRNVYDVFESIESGAMANRRMAEVSQGIADGLRRQEGSLEPNQQRAGRTGENQQDRMAGVPDQPGPGYRSLSAGDQSLGAIRAPLDMSPEARKARAEQMGFDTNTVWYHGTRTGRINLADKVGPQPWLPITTDVSLAENFGATSVIPMYLKKGIAIFDGSEEHVRRLKDVMPDRLKGKIDWWQLALGNWFELEGVDATYFSQAGFEGYKFIEKGKPAIAIDPKNNIRSVNATFDPAEAGSARLMAMFAGENAKTADLEALSKAKQMDAEGKPREAIWKDTGWFKGVDGKWRFEISDHKAYFDENAAKDLKDILADDGKAFDYMKDTLPFGGVVGHRDLFGAYPALSDLQTHFIPSSKFGSIKAAFSDKGGGRISFNDVLDAESGRSYGLHESQHAIQAIESFARGGRHDNWPTEMLEAERARIAAEQAARPKLDDWTAVDNSIAPADMTDVDLGRSLYRRLAGEAEARLVQKRMNMTPEERRARPPWLDYDVPEADQIVRMANEAIQMSLEDKPLARDLADVQRDRDAADLVGACRA